MAGETKGRRVFAMEISPAYIDVAVERWLADTGRDAILDGAGRTFAAVKAERLGDNADAPADAPATDAEREPARARVTLVPEPAINPSMRASHNTRTRRCRRRSSCIATRTSVGS